MMLPPILRTFLTRRKPAPPRCTPDNLERYGISPDCIARSEPYWRNQPETLDAIVRSGDGCCTGDCNQGRDCPHRRTI